MSKFNKQRELFESGMAEQLCFVADQNGMLFFALVQTHDGAGDLAPADVV